MDKKEQVKSTISNYLYTRDDLLDLNNVDEIAEKLAERLVVL